MISILFATHNGERTLPRMLEALARLKKPSCDFEIIAVDNASTDRTQAILREAEQKLQMKVLFMDKPGKLPALKLGANYVSGDLILFTDDDVIPSEEWLSSYEAAAAAHPRSFLFGGPITPTAMETLSPWYEASTRHHEVLFARSHHSGGAVDAVAHLFGPNFMIRRAHLDVLSQVPDALGPRFDRSRFFPMGEDSEIIKILVARGAEPIFVPDAGVSHLVRAYQTELPFMLDRAERHGRGTSIRMIAESRRAPLTRLRILLVNLIAFLRARRAAPAELKPSSEVFDRLWEIRWPLGAIGGAFSAIGKSAHNQ